MGSNYDYTKLNGAYAIWKFFLTRKWYINPLLAIHELIQRFFNNYSSGLLFKNSFFSKYSLRLQKKSFWKYYFYEITPRICDENTYNGYNKGIMSELAQVSRDN